MRLLPLFFALLLLGACSSKEETWTKIDLYKMAVKIEPNLEFVLPKDLASGVQCRNYPPGCVRGMRAKLRRELITAVEFTDKKKKKNAAFNINQYYAKNWVFDDVTGEPVLESFVKQAFGAIRPKEAK